MNGPMRIPTVNYHLWKPCNMHCGFCFATFQDIPTATLPAGHLGREGCLSVVEALGKAGFRKINFAGGEPTLCPWLPDLLRRAKALGLTTSVVTNGSRVTKNWLAAVGGGLDWTALSVDSVHPDTLRRTGRTTPSGPMTEEDYLTVIALLQEHDVRVKVNTVVTRQNLAEDLTGFIVAAYPERWKLLQALPVEGQNDPALPEFTVTPEEFDAYVRHSRRVEAFGVTVVPEPNDLMRGSYVMVDPAGRFFDNASGGTFLQPPDPRGGRREEALGDVYRWTPNDSWPGGACMTGRKPSRQKGTRATGLGVREEREDVEAEVAPGNADQWAGPGRPGEGHGVPGVSPCAAGRRGASSPVARTTG